MKFEKFSVKIIEIFDYKIGKIWKSNTTLGNSEKSVNWCWAKFQKNIKENLYKI